MSSASASRSSTAAGSWPSAAPAELKHRVQSESIFRLELDRLDAAARARLPGSPASSRAVAAADDGADGDRQTVVVNLTLAEDAALGGVVGALGGLGAHIVALRKSRAEPGGRLRRARRPRLRGRRRARPTTPATGRVATPATGGATPATGGATGPATRRATGPATADTTTHPWTTCPNRRSTRANPNAARSAAGERRVSPKALAPRSAVGPVESADWPRRRTWLTNLRARRRAGLSARRRASSASPRGSSSKSCCRSLARRPSCSSTGRCRHPHEYIGFVVLGGAMTAFWLNVDVDDGRPAVLGEGPGQPGASTSRRRSA